MAKLFSRGRAAATPPQPADKKAPADGASGLAWYYAPSR
jgi:hypothetical protein